MRQYPNIIITCLVLLLSVSCIDRDVLNVSDSLEIHSRYSLPIGVFDLNINDYLQSLASVPVSAPDSIYYEDVLYPNLSHSVYFSSTDSFVFNVVRNPSDKVKSIELVVLLSNGYPTEAAVQVYFLSGSSPVEADSVFTGGPVIIPPAEVNDEGVVTSSQISLYSFFMPSEFLQKLQQINAIMIKGHVNTTRSDIRSIKFYSKYKVNLHIGARIELMLHTSEL